MVRLATPSRGYDGAGTAGGRALAPTAVSRLRAKLTGCPTHETKSNRMFLNRQSVNWPP